MRRTALALSVLLLVMSLLPAFAPVALAQSGLPSYQLQYLGTGSPAAINSAGVVVGASYVNGNYSPLVSLGGAPWSALPAPAGGVSVIPTDINDSGVIVGVSYDAGMIPVAVRWTPSGSGYTVEMLPRLAGSNSGYATAINNLGQIVGARSAMGYAPTGTGWVYSDSRGLVDLNATYGFAVWPADLNDSGMIIGGTETLDLNTGQTGVLPPGPSNYYPITGKLINNNGQIGGTSSMRSSSLNIVTAYRYDPGVGWKTIGGTSQYTRIASLNLSGDVGWGELGGGVYLEGLGNYSPASLLDSTVTAAGWSATGSSPKINNNRLIATTGSNAQTGQSGGVLLTPVGTVQPPSAPANLQGQPHYATQQEPWNSIDLTWQNTSSQTTSFELERSLAGANAWAQIATPTQYATLHQDTTVETAVTYDYRIRAVGIAGPGAWSNVATVTAPLTPLDKTPPTVDITSPANGANVSGTVVVTAQASDNVAVTYLEISFWNQYTGQEVILGATNGPGPLSVNWNTSGLKAATYALHATANDAIGNWTRDESSVNVTSGGGGGQALRVTSIAMSGSVRGSTASISGTVTVKDGSGKAVSGAKVDAKWTLPNNTTKTVTGTTGSAGTVKFSASGARGTYTLTVTNVTKSGYTFDKAGSVLAGSITK